MGRRPCCEKVGLNRGPWTVEEDLKLTNFILNHGIHCWRLVPKLSGLRRCGKSCRLRWVNYLRPDLKRGDISEAEEDDPTAFLLWQQIAAHFPGRTDNEIKNHWNTRIKKKLKRMGMDPQTTDKPVEGQQPESMLKENDNGSVGTAEESKEQEEISEGCSNQSTAYSTETDHIFWQIRSFEEELITCSSNTSCQQLMGAPIQEEDIQNWIGSLQECLLSSDAIDVHYINS